MNIEIPRLALVVLVGVSGSGKSTFAAKMFAPTEVVSADMCRALVADDRTDQSATEDAFALLREIASRRLARGRLTVIDATNVYADDRKRLLELASEYHVAGIAFVLNVSERECLKRNENRGEDRIPSAAIRGQARALKRSLPLLGEEAFSHVFQLDSAQEISAIHIVRRGLPCDAQHIQAVDVIGDLHGCYDELTDLLNKLGYHPGQKGAYRHPEGRTAVFVGDIVDRGPRILDTFSRVYDMVCAGSGLCVPGNHEYRLLKALSGVQLPKGHGLDATLGEIDALPEATREETIERLRSFFSALPAHLVLDQGRLVVAHAGLKEDMHGREAPSVLDFALYGDTTGEIDEMGFPIRRNWASNYRGEPHVLYGHVAVRSAEWLNRTMDLDTGCVFGGGLTAMRYPEMELVTIPARRRYVRRAQPGSAHGEPADLTLQQRHDQILRYEDVSGRRSIKTSLGRRIGLTAMEIAAAIEAMNRFAVDPRWIIYLPPTMSPCNASHREEFLEHPSDALDYYRDQQCSTVVCQQKHMGSRATVIVCEDEEAALERFGTAGSSAGACYTRTGRRFFREPDLEREVLDAFRTALSGAGWWEIFSTSWFCIDCEILPWSLKASDLIRDHYDAVATAGTAALTSAVDALRQTAERSPDAAALLELYKARQERMAFYASSYEEYCWTVSGIEDIRIAPFHVLASEGAVHTSRDHLWHMTKVRELCESAPGFLLATPHQTVDPSDPEDRQSVCCWWDSLEDIGQEGIVVKPLEFVPHGNTQPAIKCRGREYLRMIYGPDYTEPANLLLLKKRSLRRKRSLALAEFALGAEALQRFVHREPLRSIHECVLGVLALESEPLDPRL